MGLSQKLNDPQIHAKIAADCTELMDKLVAEKKGLGSVPIKAAYKVLKGISPGYITKALIFLAPKAIAAFEPLWEEGVATGDPVQHVTQHKDRAAELLLDVTDRQIAVAQNKIVIGTYNKLRKSIKGDVESAVPGLAQIISQYA